MRRMTLRTVRRMRGVRHETGRSTMSAGLIFFIVWIMLGLTFGGVFFKWQMDYQNEMASQGGFRTKENQVILSYIDQGLAAVSRGVSTDRTRQAENNQNIKLLSNIIDAAYPLVAVVDPTEAHATEGEGEVENTTGAGQDTGIEAKPQGAGNGEMYNQVQAGQQAATKSAIVASPEPVEKPKQIKIDESKPVVIIYHTHATESYMPVSDGNFHSVDEKATVRQVGDALAKELEDQGIQVIHNKTLHDSPSYNQSYNRSLATIKTIMESTKAPKIIIDLHRDAAGYTSNKALTTTVDGTKVAQYGFVVGTANKNAKELKVLANYLISKSNEKYPGIARKLIEKPYKYNEYLSDYYMLLEVGNNQNHIDESVAAAKCFAKILAQVVKDNFE